MMVKDKIRQELYKNKFQRERKRREIIKLCLINLY